ncbi:ketoacyl-ACP synthase III [Fluoribacter dumoffii]|uniref:Beta-ketoacyl-[acyl-carrier-protein] synthase III n=1 Tax=Fluoribacter dumoffii TaxID=463 RepID=A0A377GA79_9GAMM|nr:beta-ketoacyl-ACP synthase III [Fluoribacter dumoffii]KTC90151.1 3-oxoacyl-ACP synthase [Fluoribacter dumoffii NY 23]MCW8385447.1 ketoacyl-ACP synthase III [Fluoribacter dumoffii]MCW8496256.1 ketoacyl-ACP synthase III [Fluoribacter dumoffii]STO21268.1 3-oxoacyl-[acyl-carrier-protein] synthase 3 [Fluoribacter dumoffii]
MRIKVIASGSFLPKKVIHNADFEKVMDTSDEWITQMTGIKKRHFLEEKEDYLNCCYHAASMAIERADLSPQLIDLIIVGTTTPYQLMPSTAVMLQQKLGINHCISFDMQAACSGFIYALANAYYMMQAHPQINYALVMGCDAFSMLTDPNDRVTRILFGDGFGAFLLKRSSENDRKGIFYCSICADGLGKGDLEVPWGVAKGYSSVEWNKPYLVMNGKKVFKNAVNQFVKNINTALEQTNLSITDVHHIIPHQANIRIIDAIANSLGISLESFHVTLNKHGNTSAASIPMAFDDLYNQGKVNPNDIILLTAFGAGYTWGTIIFEF